VAGDQKVRPAEWLVPLAFVACAAWAIWNGPAYIISFGWASEAVAAIHTPATLVEYLALAGAALFFVLGVATAGASHMEYQDIRGFDRVSIFLGRVTMALIVLLVTIMLYEVLLRYVFENPTLWANELSLWLAGFIFLLAGLYAMQQRSHIRIFIVYDIFPRWLQKLCDTISVILIVVFATALVYGAFGEAQAKFLRWETFGTAFDPPIPATVKPIVLIVVWLVAIQAVSNLFTDWNKAPEHHTAADDIDAEEIEALKKTLRSDP
jgi:TRAP-type mannitol/chloroaromatic compound transport system permease small subunit